MNLGKKGFTIHMDEEVIDSFRTYCNVNALKISAKVEMLLKRELDNAKVNPTLVEMFKKIIEGQKIIRVQKSDEQTRVIENIDEDMIKNAVKDIVNETSKGIKNEPKTQEQETKEEPKKNVPTIDFLKRMKSA